MHLFYKLPSGAFDYALSPCLCFQVFTKILCCGQQGLCASAVKRSTNRCTPASPHMCADTVHCVHPRQGKSEHMCHGNAMMPCSSNITPCSNVIELKFQLDTFVFLVYNYTYSRQPLSYYFVISFFSQSISDNMILVARFCWN